MQNNSEIIFHDIEEMHKLACEQKQNYYIDPKTGYRVFTRHYLQNRGKCCNSGCRHCPYKKTI